MPKNLTPAMRTHLDAETTQLGAIWRITRKDGQEFLFTDHDRDIVLDGDKVMAQRYDGVSGQVLSASAYLGGAASGTMRIGLYADDAGEPGALIATTEEKAFTATSSGHWEAFTFTSPPTTDQGVKYWLACHTDVTVNSRGSDGANQNDARRFINQAFATGLPDPYGAGSSYSNTRGMHLVVWTNP